MENDLYIKSRQIDFRKEREFGDVLNATFSFIGQEFRGFGTAILFYAVPFLIIIGITSVYLQLKTVTMMTTSNALNYSYFIGEFSQVYLLLLIVGIIGHTVLFSTVYNYINLYITKGKDNFTLGDVFSNIVKTFFPLLGASIVISIICSIGFVFCLIPGIYLSVSLSLVLITMIIEKKGFGNAFSRSFDLTKTQWWRTLLLLFVVFLIIAVLGGLIGLPGQLTNFFEMFNELKKGIITQTSQSLFTIIYSGFAAVVNHLLYVIFYIVIAFQYFNLVEKKEKPSLLEKIDQIKNNA